MFSYVPKAQVSLRSPFRTRIKPHEFVFKVSSPLLLPHFPLTFFLFFYPIILSSPNCHHTPFLLALLQSCQETVRKFNV